MSNEQTNQPGQQLPQLLFNAGAVAASNDAAAVARATQEIQAALVIAQRFPRDEIVAIDRILKACQRKSLAEFAEYEYRRGGTRITGPTIDLLRAIASRWGRIRFGWEEVERQNGASRVHCYAWDLQSLAHAERTFTVTHVRDRSEAKGGSVELTEERDIYELMANMAARRVRACLEEVIDGDVIQMAVDQCRKTMRDGEKEPLRDRALKILQAFQALGVEKKMIEERLGNSMESISENQLAALRRIWKSLSDGVAKREDFFKAATASPDFAGTAAPAAPAPQPDPELAAMGLAPETKGTQTGTQVPPPVTKAPAGETIQPQTNGNRLVKALRGLCQMGHCPEGKLLEFAASIGVSDGSATSLEELAMTNTKGLQRLHDDWAVTLQRIKDEIGI